MDDLILETEDKNEYFEMGKFVLHADEENEPAFLPDTYEDLFIGAENNAHNDDNLLTDDLFEDGDYYTMQQSEKPSAFNVWFIIISLILLVTVAVLCVCIFYVPTKLGVTPTDYLQQLFETVFAK